MLIDSFGRAIDYLRLSITDRCNLRCVYCMPSERVYWLTHNEILRFEELLEICRILAGMGISNIKVTGGEPLVRRKAATFIKELKAIKGIRHVTMTSNGILLGEYIESLAAAGLDAINISVDTLDKEKFKQLTGKDCLTDVFSAIDQALEFGFRIKINCVPLCGFNENDIVKLAALAKDKNITVRFIELMPLGTAGTLKPFPMDKVIFMIEEAFGPMQFSTTKLGNGPARYYRLQDFKGHIGLISAHSHSFCDSCNRLRLNASGTLEPCLSSGVGLDLRSLIRNGVSDKEIKNAIYKLIVKKPKEHNFNNINQEQDYVKKQMFRIGG